MINQSERLYRRSSVQTLCLGDNRVGKVTEKYEENKTQGEIHTVQCAECKGETRHKVIQSLDYSGSEVFNGGL